MRSSFVLIVVVLFVTTVLLAGALTQFASDAAERARIRSRNALAAAERRDRRLVSRLDAALQRTKPGSQLAAYLAGGGVSMPPVVFVALNVALSVVAYFAVAAVLPVWLALPAALGAVYASVRLVERQRRRRRERFINQLPDVARLISNGSQAGLSLLRALELAQADLDAPAGEELDVVASQIRLGQPLDRALSEMTRRMPSRDVGVLVSTLVIQQRAGGDVVEALSDLAETLEARRDTAREVKVVLVGAVFTSYVIPFLVIGLLLLLNLTSPGALDQLVSSLAGQAVLVVAGTLTTIGYLLIRRITRTEL